MIKSGDNKINLVIFTLYFPPEISTASNRLEAFAKYFNKNVFNITVICPETGKRNEFKEIEKIRIIRLENKPHFLKIKFTGKESFVVHKLKALYNKIFTGFIHNENRNWEDEAIKAFMKINKNSKVDIVLSTFPTVEPHSAVLKLKNEGYDFKWIADMRDEMSLNPYNNRLNRIYLSKIEKRLFEKADLITTTTPALVKAFKGLAKGKVAVEEIRNGYDFEISDDYNYNEVFTICHTGTFYSDIKPYSFLKAISSLKAEKRLPEMKIVFVGAGNTVVIPSELKSIVTTTSKIPHKQAEKRIKEADANLLIVPGSISKYLPGKLYEYIASRKPVIALSGINSESAKLIRDCNAGFIADFDNIDDIKNVILTTYNLWKEKKRLKVKMEYFKQFHRKEQVKKLEKMILEKL